MARALLLTIMLSFALGLAARADEPVRIGHAIAFPPFAEVTDGRSQGLAIDIVAAAAARQGLSVVWVALPFEDLQPALKDGRIQAVVPVAMTAERREVFDFSEPLFETGGALFGRASDAPPGELPAMAGKVVATPGTGPLAGYLRDNVPDIRLLVTRNYEDTLARVVRGEADAGALNLQVGARLAARLYPGQIGAPRLFFSEGMGVAATKDAQQSLLVRINAGLASIKVDGTLGAIERRWTTQ